MLKERVIFYQMVGSGTLNGDGFFLAIYFGVGDWSGSELNILCSRGRVIDFRHVEEVRIQFS